MIAEDDGEIDTDLPELQREDRIGRFGFKYLGIVEVRSAAHDTHFNQHGDDDSSDLDQLEHKKRKLIPRNRK